MDTREKIARFIEKHGVMRGPELCRHFGISRQALHVHLRKLIEAGRIEKAGSTRGASYHSAGKAPPAPAFRRTFRLKGLAEDEVYAELAIRLRLRKEVSAPVEQILHYGFTEILNNAIDHSKAMDCSVEFILEPYRATFIIREKGIGVFHSIAEKFHLRDEHAAVGELIKGKTTTMAQQHSGEGIFFTSKAADTLVLRSHQTEVEFQTFQDDIVVREKRFLKGTQATFCIRRRSRRKLEDIFKQYAPEEFDFRFERTRVFVKLFQEEYTSRSEAKRMLANLDRFQEIVLDFQGVKSLGQGFVDEVFRVYRKRHPGIRIRWKNVSRTIEPMLAHGIDNII